MVNKAKPTIAKQLSILESDLKKKSPRTVKYYLCISRKFLAKSGDFSRPGMIKFLESMGYCDNSVRTTYYVLKRLCKALEIPFPLDTEFLPPLPDEEEVYTPTTSVDNTKSLIVYWRQYPGEYITSLVFMTTMFGFRSIEMVDIEIRKGSIVVNVAKRRARPGKPVQREYSIPEDKMKYLSGYEPMSERTVEYAFGKACRRAGIKRMYEENWHSLRRRLNTSFIDAGVNKTMFKRFLRWSRDRRDMSDMYYHKDFPEIVEEMYKCHPFLKLW